MVLSAVTLVHSHVSRFSSTSLCAVFALCFVVQHKSQAPHAAKVRRIARLSDPSAIADEHILKQARLFRVLLLMPLLLARSFAVQLLTLA